MAQRFETINDNLSGIFANQTVLEILTEFEGVLDSMDMYAYENWIKGEVVDGPHLERYWVTVTLMYPQNKMPNPEAASRLTQHGCKVFYGKDHYLKPVKVTDPEDLEYKDKPFTQNQEQQRRPKLERIPVWLVRIEMPRHFVDSQASEIVRVNQQDVDVNDIVSGYDQGLDNATETLKDQDNE